MRQGWRLGLGRCEVLQDPRGRQGGVRCSAGLAVRRRLGVGAGAWGLAGQSDTELPATPILLTHTHTHTEAEAEAEAQAHNQAPSHRTLNGARGILRSMRVGLARVEAALSSPPMGPRAYGDWVGRPAVGVSASPARYRNSLREGLQ